MRRLLPFLLALLAPATAAGETLSVRAGEHGDYSRLVIPNPPADWKIATSDRKIEITFPDKDTAFELSDIIDKRKAHRVLNARVIDLGESRSLVLSLTCDCPVRTSKSAGDSIIIDIFKDQPVTLAEEETQPAKQVSDAAKNVVTATPESMREARDRMIALLAEARHQGVIQLKIDEERDAEAAAAHDGQDAPQDALKGAHEPTQAAHTPEAVDAPAHAEPAAHAAALPEHAAQDDHAQDNTHHAPSLADGPPENLVMAEHLVDENCVNPAFFNEPGDDALDFSAITDLRHKFDASLDDVERNEIAVTLAMAYIHIGFFEEAGAIAGLRGKEGDRRMAMTAGLADLAAGSRARAARSLATFRKCGPFGELAFAAAAQVDDDRVVAMQEKHLSALKPITRELRAPLAEWLGLNAIERNQMTIAKEFYEASKAARGRQRTPALAIMENALAGQLAEAAHSDDGHGEDTEPTPGPASNSQDLAHAPVITEELKAIAQTPGPLQAQALAILADDYQRRADAAYVGLLDDIAAQSGRRNSSLAEARASFTGAKALATAGRLREGIAVLEAAAHAAPGAETASRALAQSMIMNGLMEDAKTRLMAIASFFHHREFVDVKNDGDLNIAVARELAAYGANDLVEKALEGAPSKWKADGDAVRALSHLNSGDPHGALAIADKGAMSADLGVVAAKAHERLNDRVGAIALIKASLRRGAADNEFTNTAWRAGDWRLAAQAFNAVPKKEREPDAASRAALAALNTGARAIPKSAQDALAEDPDTLAALTHMFTTAPAVSVRAIDALAEFTNGVKKETDFMETGLAAGGGGQ